MRLDGGFARQTPSAILGMSDLHPAWSSDGKEIAFVRIGPPFDLTASGSCARTVRTSTGSWRSTGVEAIRPDGTGRRHVSDIPIANATGADHPAWSPDASTIAFGAGYDIWLVSAAGGEPLNLMHSDVTEDEPSWRPLVGDAGLSSVPCVQLGTAGDDTLVGSGQHDVFWPNAGNDMLVGKAGNDVLYDGPGSDRAYGGAGDDLIYGGGRDAQLIDGGSGEDRLRGSASADVIRRRAGQRPNLRSGRKRHDRRRSRRRPDLRRSASPAEAERQRPHRRRPRTGRDPQR
jgi:hypothetical protein